MKNTRTVQVATATCLFLLTHVSPVSAQLEGGMPFGTPPGSPQSSAPPSPVTPPAAAPLLAPPPLAPHPVHVLQAHLPIAPIPFNLGPVPPVQPLFNDQFESPWGNPFVATPSAPRRGRFAPAPETRDPRRSRALNFANLGCREASRHHPYQKP